MLFLLCSSPSKQMNCIGHSFTHLFTCVCSLSFFVLEEKPDSFRFQRRTSVKCVLLVVFQIFFLVFLLMAKSRNVLTNYFKKKTPDIIAPFDQQLQSQQQSDNEEDQPEAQRSELDDNNSSPSTALSSATALVISAVHGRDPSRGPSFAKDFVLVGPFQPQCKFPTVDHRHFCADWYGTYKWLEYSQSINRAFCYVCRLSFQNGKIDNSFTVNGFGKWKNAVRIFITHQSYPSHKEAYAQWTTTVQSYDKNIDVLKSLDKTHSRQAEENRAYLREIIKSVQFLARQGLSCE